MNNKLQIKIVSSLAYAVTQTEDVNLRRLIIQEFWNSLNRKGVIANHEVTTLIEMTYLTPKYANRQFNYYIPF